MTTTAVRQLSDRIVESARSAAGEWQQFWFRAEDPITLGLIRILTGLMLTYNLLVWSLEFEAFFGPDGLQPAHAVAALHSNSFAWSFWLYVPPEWLFTVHGLCIAIAVLFCLGCCSRVTSLLAFVITISYSQRVPVANFGLDQILGFLCLYLAIGPSGAALSVDRWFRVRRALRRGIELLPAKLSSARMTRRLIQIHVCIIYFWAGFSKLKGDTWWTGESMWQVIANLEYQTTDLTWMARVPWLPYLIAHVTVAWEVFFCVLIWNQRLRPFLLAMGTLMHIGIGAFLGMWTFGLIMTFPYLAFSRPSRWRRLAIWNTAEAGNPVEFVQPSTPGPEPDDDETECDLQTAPHSSPPSEPIRGKTSDDEIIGEEAPDTAPPIVIDYRKTRQQGSAQPVAAAADSETTQTIDDEYVVAGDDSSWHSSEHISDSFEGRDRMPSPEPYGEDEFPETEHDPAVDQIDFDTRTLTGDEMAEKQPPAADDSKQEVAVSRMERIKPKSANSVTGAPKPKVDGRVEESVLAPETEVLLVALHAPERNTFRTYLRRHDIPCRAATSAENAVSIVLNMKPAAVLLSGSCLNPEEIITLVDDLNDMVDAPILALLTMSQIKLLSNDPLAAHIMQYPASLREIREELTSILLQEGNAKPRCSLRSALGTD